MNETLATLIVVVAMVSIFVILCSFGSILVGVISIVLRAETVRRRWPAGSGYDVRRDGDAQRA